MAAKLYSQMTEAERAEIDAQEDAREARKEAMSDGFSDPEDWDAFLASKHEAATPDADDEAEYWARVEERMDGVHKDSLYW